MTPSGIGKSFTITDCHSKRSFSGNAKGFLKKAEWRREREKEREGDVWIYGTSLFNLFTTILSILLFPAFYHSSVCPSIQPPTPQWPHVFFALMDLFRAGGIGGRSTESVTISHQCNQLDDEQAWKSRCEV